MGARVRPRGGDERDGGGGNKTRRAGARKTKTARPGEGRAVGTKEEGRRSAAGADGGRLGPGPEIFAGEREAETGLGFARPRAAFEFFEELEHPLAPALTAEEGGDAVAVRKVGLHGATRVCTGRAKGGW